MPFYYHPVFVAFFLASPLIFFILGTVLRISFGGSQTISGRLGVYLQFLSQITFILVLFVSNLGSESWPLIFNGVSVYGWIILVITGILGILAGDQIIISSGGQETDFGLPHFWIIFVAIIFVITMVGFLISAIWAALQFLYGIFLEITSIKG